MKLVNNRKRTYLHRFPPDFTCTQIDLRSQCWKSLCYRGNPQRKFPKTTSRQRGISDWYYPVGLRGDIKELKKREAGRRFSPLPLFTYLLLIGPLPVTNFRHIVAVLLNVMFVFDQFILQLLFDISCPIS